MAGIIIRQGENTLQAAASALVAEAWAEGTLPGGAGTKSAKEWAGDAAASAASIPAAGLSNIWHDGRLRALYDANQTINAGATTLYLDGVARVLATAGTLYWDTAASPFGNPALVTTGVSTDLYVSLADIGLRIGQSIKTKVGLIVDSGSTFTATLFARTALNGTVTGNTAAVSFVGAGAYAEKDLAEFTIPAGTTVLALRVSRTAGSGSAKICAIQAVLGALARPMDEDRASSYNAYRGTLLGTASRRAAAHNLALLTATLDKSKNLFNPADPDVLTGYYISDTSGLPVASASYNASGFIPVVPGEQYTVSYGHRRAYYDAYGRYVSGVNDTSLGAGSTFTIPAGCYFMRQGVTPAVWATFQVEAGASKTSYAAFTPKLKSAALPPLTGSMFADESIAVGKLTPLDRSKNLFNPDDPDFADGYYVSFSSGNLAANATYAASGFIPVTESTEYTASYSHQRAFYNASKVYISGTNSGNPGTFTTPAGCAYVRLTMLASGVGSFQFELGGTATAYEAYYSPRIPYASLPPGIETVADRLDAVATIDGAPLFNPYKPELLRHCHYRLMRRALGETGQLVISVAGDSYTHNAARWSGPFTDYLAAKYGDAGGGWCGFGFNAGSNSAPWTAINQPQYRQGNVRPATYPTTLYGSMTSTYAHLSPSGSPDLCTITMTASGDYVTQAMPATPVHNGCDLFFEGTSDGVVRYKWDSGSWTSVNVQGAVGQVQKVAITTGMPSGAGTLTVEWVSGTVKLCGVNLTSAADGVRVNKLACTGSNIGQWAAATATEWERGLGLLNHHAFIYMDGANSQAGSMGASTWGGHLATIIGRLRTATPGLDILIATPPENQRGYSPSMTVYAAEARKRAQALRVAYMDMQDAFGDPFNPTEYGSAGAIPLFNADLIHPEPATGGRRLLAEFLKCVEPL